MQIFSQHMDPYLAGEKLLLLLLCSKSVTNMAWRVYIFSPHMISLVFLLSLFWARLWNRHWCTPAPLRLKAVWLHIVSIQIQDLKLDLQHHYDTLPTLLDSAEEGPINIMSQLLSCFLGSAVKIPLVFWLSPSGPPHFSYNKDLFHVANPCNECF